MYLYLPILAIFDSYTIPEFNFKILFSFLESV